MKARFALALTLAGVGTAACDGLLGINPLDGGAGRGTDSSDLPPVDASTPSDFALTVAAQRVTVVRGSSAQLSVSLVWPGSTQEAVTVTAEASGLPPGVSAAPVTIPTTTTAGALTVDATAGATLTVTGSVTITATGGGFTHEATVPLFVQDPPGTLDVTFGADGVAVIPIPKADDFTAIGLDGIAIQTDGKIVLCGNGSPNSLNQGPNQVILARITDSGGADYNFGSYAYGFTIWNEPGGTDVCNAVKVLSSGSIAIAGFRQVPAVPGGPHGFLAGRFTSQGMPDSTFGNGGFVSFGGGVDCKANDMVVEQNGDLLLGGFVGADMAFLALLPDGGADPSFGVSDAGLSLFPKPPGGGPCAMGLLPNGDVLSDVSSSSFFASQITPGGALESGYGRNGWAAAAPSAPLVSTQGLAIQSDGKAVVVGAGDDAGTLELARFDPAGALDPSFGDGGLVSTSIGSGRTVTGGAVATADGHLVVAILSPTFPATPTTPYLTGDIGVVRYDASGALDTTFNGVGYATPGTFPALTDAVAIDSAGRIVLAAFATSASDPAVLVARFWP